MRFKTYSWNCYASSSELDFKIHRVRDGAAFAEVAGALSKFGLSYHETLCNCSFDAEKMEQYQNKNQPLPIIGSKRDYEHLQQGDLLVLTTRPPCSDELGDRARIARSCTWLEHKIVHKVRTHFEVCSRSHMKLTKASSVKFKAGKLADVKFRQYKKEGAKRALAKPDAANFAALDRASVKEWKEIGVRRYSSDVGEPVTITYLMFEPSLWSEGPALLAMWGMGGNETLGFCHLLRKRHADLLLSLLNKDEPALVLGKMETPPIPASPMSLSFVDGWKLEIV